MQFVLLTGADIGEKELTLQKAASIINERIGRVIRTSRFFESAPWGFESETTFLNQALLIETKLQPEALLKELQAIEKELGRIRKDEQWISRTIDIDILCSENLIHHSDSLIIPHLHLREREFALEPLCELVPEWKHPLLKTSYSELLAGVKIKSERV